MISLLGERQMKKVLQEFLMKNMMHCYIGVFIKGNKMWESWGRKLS
jgi:hypothetical protein